MSFDEPETLDAENVDEMVNNQLTKVVSFQVHHWTSLKTTQYPAQREMIFPEDQDNGFIQALKCTLADSKTAAGDKASVNYILFDANYIKYQILTLLRDILWECDEFNEAIECYEFEIIHSLINEAIDEFRRTKNQLIDSAPTPKAITAKNVTQSLKAQYKP